MRWKTPRIHRILWKTLQQKHPQEAPEAIYRVLEVPRPGYPGPTGVSLCRKAGLMSYSTSEIWRVGGMEGVEGERISTPLAVV